MKKRLRKKKGCINTHETFQYTMSLHRSLLNEQREPVKWTQENFKQFTQNFKNLIFYLLKSMRVDKSLFSSLNSEDITLKYENQVLEDCSIANLTERMAYDLFYFSDRWTLNRVIRIIILYHAIANKLYEKGISVNDELV